MKVEFTADEVWRMMSSVVDELAGLEISKQDRAAIRRWRSDEMKPGSAAMTLLTEKLNAELQRSGEREKVSPIKKPDWL